MKLFKIAVIVLALCAPSRAQAQDALNPFAEPAAFVAARSATGNATLRLRYQLTEQKGEAAATQSELTIDVATNWALVRSAERVALYDYALGRDFEIAEASQAFTSFDLSAIIAFRVLERQNRKYMGRILSGAGGEAPDGCDPDSELGIDLPTGPHARAEFRNVSGRVAFRCNRREAGGFTPGAGAPPPPAFWPTMMLEMTVHPALFHRVRDTRRAPAELTITMAHAPIDAVSRTWRLVASEPIDEPFPLTASLTNEQIAAIDAITGPGVGAIAADAVAGRAMGGVPTLESWDAYVAEVARKNQNESALMISMSTLMFPELNESCEHGMRHAVCDAITNLLSALNADPAVNAMYRIAQGEQTNHLERVVDLMHRAQESPLANHPALGQSYALALLKFDDANLTRAREAGLPTDPIPLMAATLRAFPYCPAYWTDIADYYANGYRAVEAAMLYDVAFALPMPSAQRSNQLLTSRRHLRERFRQDFPDYALPH